MYDLRHAKLLYEMCQAVSCRLYFKLLQYITVKLVCTRCRIYHCAYVCLSTGPHWPVRGEGIFLPKNPVYMSDLIHV
jgi:hypothetical protein